MHNIARQKCLRHVFEFCLLALTQPHDYCFATRLLPCRWYVVRSRPKNPLFRCVTVKVLLLLWKPHTCFRANSKINTHRPINCSGPVFLTHCITTSVAFCQLSFYSFNEWMNEWIKQSINQSMKCRLYRPAAVLLPLTQHIFIHLDLYHICFYTQRAPEES